MRGMKPSDCFEMMVWERLYAAILSREESDPALAASQTDTAFREYAKRRQDMLAAIEAKNARKG